MRSSNKAASGISSKRCTTKSYLKTYHKWYKEQRKKEKISTAYNNWQQETTNSCKKELDKYKVTDWVVGQRARQFGFAGHTMRRTDGRWTTALITWHDGNQNKVHKPIKSKDWDYDIIKWFKNSFPKDHREWQEIAQNREVWTGLKDRYSVEWQQNIKGSNRKRRTYYGRTWTLEKALDH